MISCPNKKLKAWKDLVKAVGENEAMGLWNHYKGFVPESYYKSGIKTESIKPGVSELFESNPELANEVYESLGLINTSEIQLDKPRVNPDNFEAISYPIKINGKYAGVISVDKDGYISSSIGMAGVELEKEFQGKGYGTKVYIALAEQLAKEGKTLKSEAFGKTDINESANRVWKSLLDKGYAFDKDSYFEVQLKNKQQAQQLYSQYLDTILPDGNIEDYVNANSPKLTNDGKSLLNATFNKNKYNNKSIIYANYLADGENNIKDILYHIAGISILENINSVKRAEENQPNAKILRNNINNELNLIYESEKIINKYKDKIEYFDFFIEVFIAAYRDEIADLEGHVLTADELDAHVLPLIKQRDELENILKDLEKKFNNYKKEFEEERIINEDRITYYVNLFNESIVEDERAFIPLKSYKNKLSALLKESKEFFIGELSKTGKPTERNIFNNFTEEYINNFIEEGKTNLTVTFLKDAKNKQSLEAKIKNLVREQERRLNILKNKKNGHYLMTVLNLNQYIEKIKDFSQNLKENQILGSKKNIEGFKEFVDNKSNKQSNNEFYQLSNLLKDEEIVYTDDEAGTPISNEVDTELNNKLKNFLKKVGITYEAVEQILTSKGIEASAVTNLFTKIVQVVEGKADITTLPEETAHVFVGLMDKNSLLYKRMYNTIIKYEVYQEVLRDYADAYNNDEVKLREEAIGKLIASKIIQQNNSQDTLELNNSFGKWWNSIWQRIKDLFTSVKDDPFVEVANKILTEDTAGLKKSGENENFYQLTNTLTPEQAKILNLIDEDQKKLILVQNEKERYYTYNGQKTGKSVTTRIDEKLDKNYAEKTPEQKAKFKLSSDYGTISHADLENAGRRILSGENVARVVHTNESTYKKIEEYIKEFGKQFPKGTQFRFEIRVYDKRKSEPGTIDLLAVEPSGLTHTFDYKNTTFSKQEKEVYGEPATYKLKSWNLKVARYSSILRDNYNVTDFGYRRAIPTEFLYKQDSIKGIKLGSPTYSNEKEYLNPVPLLEENVLPKSNSKQDIENAAKINTLLNQLRKLYTDTEKIKTKDPIQRELLYEKLVKLRKAIKSLQLDTNFDKFIDAGATELSYIDQRLKDKDNPVTPAEITSFYETSNAFSNLSDSLIHLLLDKTIDKKLQEELIKLELKAKQTKSILKERFKNIIIEEALEIGETDPFAAQKSASNYFKNINQVNHPLFRIFWNLVNKKKIQTRKAIESLESKISKSVKNLEKWAGTTSIDKFKHLINDKNLISKFSPEYYKLKTKAYKDKDIDWLKNNSTVDKEGLEKFLEKKEKEIRSIKHSSNKKENDKKIQESLKRLNESYNVFKYPKAYLYEKNGFIKALDKWQSEEYKFIYKAGNEPLKEFYELFTGTIRELKEHLPVDINGNFIPEIEESLIDAIFNSGIGSISGLGDRITDSFKIKSTPGYGEVNEFTGEIERNVPIYYIGQAQKKSMDLGKSLALFAQMALNYKHMSEIEGTVTTLKHALQDENLSREYVTNTFGQVSRDESGKFRTMPTSLTTLEAFDDFMNYYLYDVRTKDKDIPLTKTSIDENGEVVTTTYSLNKGIAKTLSAYSMTSLTLNVISGGANLIGGIANVMMQASRGRYFTNKNVLKSAALLTSNNEKAYKLIEYFNIMGEQKINEKIKKLSSSKIAANVTTDKFYFLQHSGDWLVQNTTLLSMLQGHTIDKGKIVGLKKIADGKSLLDLAEIKDGKITIPGITDEEFDAFRTKTQRLAENILGMSTRDNISRYRLTLVGQVFGQFRNWIPRMAEERFGGLTYDYDLETLTKGKYISFAQQVFNKRALPLIKELIIGYGPASEARALELFEKELAAHPELAGKLTFEEFKQMHLENLNAMKTELLIIGTFVATILLSKIGDDDDEDKTPFEKQLAKLWSRSLNELTFFLNPTSFKQITKSSIPIIGLLDNISNLFYDTFKYWTGVGLSNEKWIKEAKPLKHLRRTFPITNAIDRWFEE